MGINILWSSSNGGVAITNPLDHGSAMSGSTLSSQTIYLEHDGINQITNCGFYISEKSDIYSGGFSAPADLNEILSWGNGTTSSTFGGFQINMNALGNFPISNWPVFNSKQPTSGSAFFSGVGDSVLNKILLDVTMGINNTGVIPSGVAPDISFQSRISIPTIEDTAGVREFDQKLRFTYTS